MMLFMTPPFSFRNSGMLALLPLTIDRFVAVVLPLRHKCIITTRTSINMFLLTWLPLIILCLYDTITYRTGGTKVSNVTRFV